MEASSIIALYKDYLNTSTVISGQLISLWEGSTISMDALDKGIIHVLSRME